MSSETRDEAILKRNTLRKSIVRYEVDEIHVDISEVSTDLILELAELLVKYPADKVEETEKDVIRIWWD